MAVQASTGGQSSGVGGGQEQAWLKIDLKPLSTQLVGNMKFSRHGGYKLYHFRVCTNSVSLIHVISICKFMELILVHTRYVYIYIYICVRYITILQLRDREYICMLIIHHVVDVRHNNLATK